MRGCDFKNPIFDPTFDSGPNFAPDNKKIINIRTGLNIVQNWSNSEFDTVRNSVQISLMLRKTRPIRNSHFWVFMFEIRTNYPPEADFEYGRKRTILGCKSRRSWKVWKQTISTKVDDLWVKADDLGRKQTIFWAKAYDLWVKLDDPGQSPTVMSP